MPLTKHHRRIDPYQPAGVALLFLQSLFGFFQLHQHQPCVMAEHPPGLGGGNGAGMAVEQLLVQGLFHQLDLPRNRRGRQALTAGHFGKAAVIQYSDKQSKSLESQFVETVHDQSCCAVCAKVLSGCSHLSQRTASR
jgi:hypothetical protein